MNPVRTPSKPIARRSAALAPTSRRPIDYMTPVFSVAVDAPPSSRAFAVMLEGYRESGGVISADELAGLLEEHHRGDFVSLAKLIVAGEVLGFPWRDTFWIPMFQFELYELSIKQGVRQLLAELPSTFSAWALAAWFVQHNTHLNGERPIDQLDDNPAAVLLAARTERFIATE